MPNVVKPVWIRFGRVKKLILSAQWLLH